MKKSYKKDTTTVGVRAEIAKEFRTYCQEHGTKIHSLASWIIEQWLANNRSSFPRLTGGSHE